MPTIGTPVYFEKYSAGTSNPWDETHTPQTAGSTLFLLIRYPTNRTLTSVQSLLTAGGSAGNWTLVEDARTQIERYAAYYILENSIAAEQTCTITLSGNSSGGAVLWEFPAGTTVVAGSSVLFNNSSSVKLHKCSPTNQAGTDVTVISNPWAGGNCEFREANNEAGWLRADTNLSIPPAESYAVERTAFYYRDSYTYSGKQFEWNQEAFLGARTSGGVTIALNTGGAVTDPPSQNTPTPSPINIIFGATGTIYDASGDWTLGSGGTGPLDFSAVTLAPGFSITSTGQIQSDGTPAVNTYADQQYQCDDAANNGPTLSNLFNIVVQPASATLTSPPLNDDQEQPVTGRTGITIVIYPGTSSTATPTLVLENQSQQPDGTLVINSTSLAAGTKYTMAAFEPKTDDAEAYRGIFRLTAT